MGAVRLQAGHCLPVVFSLEPGQVTAAATRPPLPQQVTTAGSAIAIVLMIWI